MKNKLFLALSLLTAGLNASTALLVIPKVSPFTSFVNTAKGAMTSVDGQYAIAGAGLCAMPVALGSVYSYRNEILKGMDNAMAHKMAAQYGVSYASNVSKELSMRDRLTNALNSTKTFVGNHKVATGAGLSAIVGLGLAYKYRKNLFGKAVAKKAVKMHRVRASSRA